MIIKKLYESGVALLAADRFFRDGRGYFLEATRRNDPVLGSLLMQQIDKNLKRSLTLVQTNVSHSAPFVLRGLHYQVRNGSGDLPQGKLLRCLSGKIYQVCVDMRADSPTRGQWWSHVLDGLSHEAVWIPPGFANGFYSFEDGALVLYEMTAVYDQLLERTLLWNDQRIGIKWPFRNGAGLVMSAKDRTGKQFDDLESWHS